MRLFLLPISTRRSLIYCQRLDIASAQEQSWLDKGTARAAKLWAGWEKKDSGWQRKVVDYGNQALKRIPYEEWGLKSIPPLSSRRQEEEMSEKKAIEVIFPETLIPKAKVLDTLKTLGTERQALHKQRLIWSIVGMPLVAPFALVPVIPNLPFFYLVFRAWSHWRALSGSRHIEFLLDKKLLIVQPSSILDKLYASGKQSFKRDSELGVYGTTALEPETMLMHESDGKRIAEALNMPELYIELDRAVWQAEKALQAETKLNKEKSKSDSVDADAKMK